MPNTSEVLGLLEAAEHPTRVRWLIAAVEAVIPRWTAWARGADLTYFSGISMEIVDLDAPEACVAAARAWLDGDGSHLSPAASVIGLADSAIAMDEWEIDDSRALYAFFAAYNLARLCISVPTGEQAGLVFRQALSAAICSAGDAYGGDEAAQAWVDRWWGACAP